MWFVIHSLPLAPTLTQRRPESFFALGIPPKCHQPLKEIAMPKNAKKVVAKKATKKSTKKVAKRARAAKPTAADVDAQV